MKTNLSLFACLMVSVIISQPAIAQSILKLPTHCKADESTYLSATMGTVADNPKEIGGYKIIKNGKVLSLCINTSPTRLFYRYGVINKVEMERVATIQKKFWYGSKMTDPHTGDEVIFFNSGDYTYLVSQAIGQGHGVSLFVIKGGKIVANLFSGTNEGVDYESKLTKLPLDILIGKDVPNLLP